MFIYLFFNCLMQSAQCFWLLCLLYGFPSICVCVLFYITYCILEMVNLLCILITSVSAFCLCHTMLVVYCNILLCVCGGELWLLVELFTIQGEILFVLCVYRFIRIII